MVRRRQQSALLANIYVVTEGCDAMRRERELPLLPDTLIICGPNEKHEGPCDMSGWADFVEPTTGRVTGGSAYCKKCGAMAFNNSIWD
jgi:hypothetical protein